MTLSPYIVWFSLAVLLVVAELMTGTFYLLMIALGVAAGGLTALLSGSFAVQLLVCAVVASVGIALLRRSRFGQPQKNDSERDPNVNLDIGQHVYVLQWDDEGRSRVAYRGSQWDVEWLEAEAQLKNKTYQKPAAGNYKIIAIRGNRLIVDA